MTQRDQYVIDVLKWEDVETLRKGLEAANTHPTEITRIIASLASQFCNSDNHEECGEILWECDACSMVYCSAEGSADNNLCDWCNEEYSEAEKKKKGWI